MEQQSDKDDNGDSYKSVLIVAIVLIFSSCAVCSAMCAVLSYFHARRRETHRQRRVSPDNSGDSALAPPPNPATMVGMPRVSGDSFTQGQAVPYEKFRVQRIGGTLHKAELLASAPVKPETETECETKVPEASEVGPRPPKTEAMDESIALCEICCDNTASIVLLPCGHGDLCRTCTMAIWQRTGGFCHVCRQPIERILELETPLTVGVVDGSISVNALRIAPDLPPSVDPVQIQDVEQQRE